MSNYSFDLQRIFFGDLPLLFFLEICLRTILLYGFALISLRLLGKRSTRQLTPVDVILIVALGSAVGDPMFYPQVPVLHGMAVIALVTGLQRLGVLMANDHRHVEIALKGSPARLIVDGTFDLEAREKSELSRAEVFAILREQGYTNLGQVERLYIETDGSASHYRFPDYHVHPGLPLSPPWELEAPDQVPVGAQINEPTPLGCSFCGYMIEAVVDETVPPCPRCQRADWVNVKQSGHPPTN
ncbi:MAG: DUF421 domain-containing protein [Anaerolineales bacterium]